MFKKIMVPVDGSDSSRQGLLQAIALAKSDGAEIRIVHVLTGNIYDHFPASGQFPSGYVSIMQKCGRSILSIARAEAQAAGIHVTEALLDAIGAPAAEGIVSHAADWGADLIIMGTHGQRGFRRHGLGADATQVLQTAHIPVLVVRSRLSEIQMNMPALKRDAAACEGDLSQEA